MIFSNYNTPKFFLIVLILSGISVLTIIEVGCRTAKAQVNENGNRSGQKETALSIERKIPFPKPESHRAGWFEYHGSLSDLSLNNPGRERSSCYTCHEKIDCIECHSIQPPRDHNNIWRVQTHGFIAEGNRERCLTCHREDYCIRCHNETTPRSHSGNWAANHCDQCHFDVGVSFGSNCSVCHKQYLHLSAPHPVNANISCTACH